MELGRYSKIQHRKIAPIINSSGIDKINILGNHIKETFKNIKPVKKGLILSESLQIISLPQQIDSDKGTVLRAKLVDGVSASVWRDGNTWVVDLVPQQSRPDVALQFVTQQTSPQGPRVFVLAEGIGESIMATDPEVGDRLFIVPILPLSRGVEENQTFSQFNLIKSIQGIVIQPLIDELEVRVMPDGVAVTASSFKGLEVSDPSKVVTQKNRNLIFSIRFTGVPIGGVLAGIFAPQLALEFGWQQSMLFSVAVAATLCLAMQPFRSQWDSDRSSNVTLLRNPLTDLKLVWRLTSLRWVALYGMCMGAVQTTLTTYTVTMLVEDIGYSPVSYTHLDAADE